MRKIISIYIICFTLHAFGNKISDAYNALSVFNYFKAKDLFYKTLNKYPSQSSFGLAIIFSKSDNPFYNIDSAAKYIIKSKANFRDTVSYFNYHITKNSIHSLEQKISNIGFNTYCKNEDLNHLNTFLYHFYFSDDSLLNTVYNKRDSIALNKAIESKRSKEIVQFLHQYPETNFYARAQKIFYEFEFVEQTPNSSMLEFKLFLKRFPSNPNSINAEKNLFKLIQEHHNTDSIYGFIKHYSSPLTREMAWKLLYSLSVKKYSKEELIEFSNKYSDYPFNETIKKEIALTENILIPLKHINEKFGYIDTLGNWIIPPIYDDANDFNEGIAAVCLNDSCFYINKENERLSSHNFEETENYKNGVAVIKNNNNYYLINRTGQFISKAYQDIIESDYNLYICQSNNLYGAINLKGEIIIPFSYTKLGKFKNNYAYYLIDKYGLVDLNNNTLKAQWEWISDLDTNSIAIVKQNSKFGLINVNEKTILPVDYDYITHCKNHIYLVVKNNFYGFYNSTENCFITSVEYDYNPSYTADYYTNGHYFKLLKDNNVSLVDGNGRISISFGTYSNLFFAKCDLIRVEKNNKYGFVNRKLKAVTSFEFDFASDFENDIAIVKKGNISSLINKNGASVFSIKDGEITRLKHNFLYQITKNSLTGLIDNEGKSLLLQEYETIEILNKDLVVCKKNNTIYLYNIKTKNIKKI